MLRESWAGHRGQCECHVGRERRDWLRGTAWTPVSSLPAEPLNSTLRDADDFGTLCQLLVRSGFLSLYLGAEAFK